MKPDKSDKIIPSDQGTIHKFNLTKFILNNLIMFGITLIMGCGLLLLIIMMIVEFLGEKYNSEYVKPIIIIFWVGFCLWWLIFTISGYRDTQIQVFDKGLIYRKKGLNKLIYWSDITEIKNKKFKYSMNYIPITSINDLTVTTTDKIKIKIDNNFNKNEELGELILKNTYENIFQRYKSIFNEGDSISLGKYEINKLCIRKGNKIISWNDIKDIKISNGYYNIYKTGGFIEWGMIPMSKITNYHVIIPFIDMIRKNEL